MVVVGPVENNVLHLALPPDRRGRVDRRGKRARTVARALPSSRRAARARNPRALGSHPSGAQVRDAGYRVGVTLATPTCCPATTTSSKTSRRSRSASSGYTPCSRPAIPPARCASISTSTPILFSGDTLFPGGPGATSSPVATSSSSSDRSRTACLRRWRRTRSCIPAMATRRRSAPKARSCRSGSTAAGSRGSLTADRLVVSTSAGLGQPEVAFGDVVAVDLAGAAVDSGDRRVARVVCRSNPSAAAPGSMELQQAWRARPSAGTNARPFGRPPRRRPWSSNLRVRAGRQIAAIHAERCVKQRGNLVVDGDAGQPLAHQEDRRCGCGHRRHAEGRRRPPRRPSCGNGAAGRHRWRRCHPSRRVRTRARRPWCATAVDLTQDCFGSDPTLS